MSSKFKKDDKVKIKNQKSILTITGETIHGCYWFVKERTCAINEKQLEKL